MGEMTQEGANIGAGIDLSQFYQVFFEEAGENLDRMEAQLLEIDLTAADDEELNSIFRCAHSVKGGAATFGFADVAELTHQMETLLDKLRRHELTPTAAMVDVLLQSGDALRAQLARHQGAGGDAVDTADLLVSIRAMSSGQAPAPAANAAAAKAVAPDAHEQMAGEAPAAKAAPTGATPARELEVRVGPLKDPAQANSLIELFNEITDLGTIEAIDGGQPSDGIRRFRVITTSSDNDLLDLFTFHVARDEVALLRSAKATASMPARRAHRPKRRRTRATASSTTHRARPAAPMQHPPRSKRKRPSRRHVLRPASRRHPPPHSNRRRCESRSRRSTSSSTWSASSSSRRRCWRRTASRSTPASISSSRPAWPTSTATRATCKSR